MSNPLSFLAPLASGTYNKVETNNTISYTNGVVNVNVNDTAYDTEIRRLANIEARNRENQSALSVMLNDYSEMCEFSKNSTRTNIPKSALEDYGIFERIKAKIKGEDLNNIYRNEDLKGHVKDNITRYKLYQQELFAIEQEFALSTYEYDSDLKRGATQAEIYYKDMSEREIKSGRGIGLRYANKDDNLEKAAENLAASDIASIEVAYSLTQEGKKTKVDGQLNAAELDSPNYYRNKQEANEALWDLDLNGDKFLDSKEYAKFILATDSDKDGILTSKEVEWANNNFDEIQKIVRDSQNENKM